MDVDGLIVDDNGIYWHYMAFDKHLWALWDLIQENNMVELDGIVMAIMIMACQGNPQS